MKKIFITGMSGYIGTRLCRELDRADWVERVDGIDVRPPLYKYDRVEYRKMDINDPGLVDHVQALAPDIFIHLAFILNPIKDSALMRRVNIDGTKNALAAAAACPQLLFASSGTAFGAWPDNKVPLADTDSIRPAAFNYAREKSELESLCREFAEKYPDKAVAMIRPCIVYGPGVDNYLSNLFTGQRVMMALKEYDPPLQFVHEDDVVGAIIAILKAGGRGPFNVAPADYVTMKQAGAISGKPTLALPFKLVRAVAAAAWALNLSPLQAPPEFLDFARWPWVMESKRLAEIGFKFRYSSRETLEIMLRSKGIMA